jgi:hypothetical protein
MSSAIHTCIPLALYHTASYFYVVLLLQESLRLTPPVNGGKAANGEVQKAQLQARQFASMEAHVAPSCRAACRSETQVKYGLAEFSRCDPRRCDMHACRRDAHLPPGFGAGWCPGAWGAHHLNLNLIHGKE